jgi:alanine racemase
VNHRLAAVLWEPAQLDEVEGAAHAAGMRAASLPVHLEIDTGMSRQGVDLDALGSLLARFHPGSPLRLDGVMTHLFAADEADGLVTDAQLARLEQALRKIEAAGVYAEWLNVGNSAALLTGQAARIAALAARHGMKAMLRPGLALYGLAPEFDPSFELEEPPSLAAARLRLQPVLAWKSRVVSLRSIPAGAVVGYNGTFVATGLRRWTRPAAW